jgi:coatomer protein complex subunit alpha (xenin)
MNPKPDLLEQARKVLKYAEANGFVEEYKMNYDERNPFVICGITFTPIYKGNKVSFSQYYLANSSLFLLFNMSQFK